MCFARNTLRAINNKMPNIITSQSYQILIDTPQNWYYQFSFGKIPNPFKFVSSMDWTFRKVCENLRHILSIILLRHCAWLWYPNRAEEFSMLNAVTGGRKLFGTNIDKQYKSDKVLIGQIAHSNSESRFINNMPIKFTSISRNTFVLSTNG